MPMARMLLEHLLEIDLVQRSSVQLPLAVDSRRRNHSALAPYLTR